MLALNELLADFDKYDAYYKRISFKADLDKIKALEASRKIVQLEFEKLRAENNKASAEIATLKNSGAAASEINLAMSEILRRERKIKHLKTKLNRFSRQINSRLKKLRPLPDEMLANNDVIFEDFNASVTLKEALSVFKNNYKYEQFEGKIRSLEKKYRDFLFQEEDLMFSAVCHDGMLIFCTIEELDENFNELLRFFYATAIKIERLSDVNLCGSATTEYKVYLKDRIISLQKNREFFSREFNIKYRDTKQDVTRFVQQITIKPNH